MLYLIKEGFKTCESINLRLQRGQFCNLTIVRNNIPILYNIKEVTEFGLANVLLLIKEHLKDRQNFIMSVTDSCFRFKHK